ncbi:MAG: four helix bundle protein [Treponema sp.]|nr:four helix bundle protein [Treponema sp.]
MALIYDLPVFNDVYQLALRLFQVTTNFPREYKFTIGQDMKRDCIVLVRYIYRANKTKEKYQHLEQFLDYFEVLKFEIRLCADLKLITIKEQADLSAKMESIGRQITAWRNASGKGQNLQG